MPWEDQLESERLAKEVRANARLRHICLPAKRPKELGLHSFMPIRKEVISQPGRSCRDRGAPRPQARLTNYAEAAGWPGSSLSISESKRASRGSPASSVTIWSHSSPVTGLPARTCDRNASSTACLAIRATAAVERPKNSGPLSSMEPSLEVMRRRRNCGRNRSGQSGCRD